MSDFIYNVLNQTDEAKQKGIITQPESNEAQIFCALFFADEIAALQVRRQIPRDLVSYSSEPIAVDLKKDAILLEIFEFAGRNFFDRGVFSEFYRLVNADLAAYKTAGKGLSQITFKQKPNV